MKAERRHELQTNSLAQALQNFPQLMQQYGARILLVITLIVLLIVLLQYRARTMQQHEVMLQQQLVGARANIAEIRQPDPRMSVESINAQRQQLTSEAEAAINDVLESADSPQMRAEALLARGDLYWALATTPTFPTTQPVAQPAQRTTDDLLRSAQGAYEQILREYTDQESARIAAMFGLAAIAENQRNWDAAVKHYTAIVEASDLPMYRELAERRRDAVDLLREPLYLGQPAPMPQFEAPVMDPDAPLPEGVAAPTLPPPQEPAPTEPPPQERAPTPAEPSRPAPVDQPPPTQ